MDRRRASGRFRPAEVATSRNRIALGGRGGGEGAAVGLTLSARPPMQPVTLRGQKAARSAAAKNYFHDVTARFPQPASWSGACIAPAPAPLFPGSRQVDKRVPEKNRGRAIPADRFSTGTIQSIPPPFCRHPASGPAFRDQKGRPRFAGSDVSRSRRIRSPSAFFVASALSFARNPPIAPRVFESFGAKARARRYSTSAASCPFYLPPTFRRRRG